MRRRENLSQKISGSPVQVQHGGPSSGAGSVYAQSAPPRPSFVNELMPDWLKERRKEQEKRSVLENHLQLFIQKEMSNSIEVEPDTLSDSTGELQPQDNNISQM